MKTYIVEHLDPELEAWSALEYSAIAAETQAAGSAFVLSSVPPTLVLPHNLQGTAGLNIEQRGVEELFTGKTEKVCLLDPAAPKELRPEDGEVFEAFLFGGILGDDPPRDRTSELRKKGYEGRRLGPVQMTTDTAVRVTRMVVEEKITLEKIPYVDFPEIRINKNESTQMPFRYVKGANGSAVMPQGMIDLIKNDAEKGLADLL